MRGRRNPISAPRVPDRSPAWPGPVDARLAEQVAVLPTMSRSRLAAVALGEAIRLGADAKAGLVERVGSRAAAEVTSD